MTTETSSTQLRCQGRPLDDIDMRVEETEANHAVSSRIEVATFAEGEYVESILISRVRAAEIYHELGRLLGEKRQADLAGDEPNADREVPICPNCCSDSVVADAAARWSVEGQIWEVSNVFDKGHGCDDCGAEDISFDWITEKEHMARTARTAETDRSVQTP